MVDAEPYTRVVRTLNGHMLFYQDGVAPFDWFNIICSCRPLARRDNSHIFLNFYQSKGVYVILVCDALEEARISLCLPSLAHPAGW